MSGLRVRVQNKAGSVTGFISRNGSTPLGLSAFHVLAGANRIIDIFSDTVQTLDKNGSWQAIGRTLRGSLGRGSGIDNDFGIIDFAVFEGLDDRALLQYLGNEVVVHPANTLNNAQTLINQNVFGYSVIDAIRISGIVKQVHCSVGNLLFDISIEITNGYTHEGDSGMLWVDSNNRALAMHIHGNKNNYAKLSYGTFLHRIVGKDQFFTVRNIVPIA